jgi:hypothetical protein
MIESSRRTWIVWLSRYSSWFECLAFVCSTSTAAVTAIHQCSSRFPTNQWLKWLTGYADDVATVVLVVIAILSYVCFWVLRWIASNEAAKSDATAKEEVDKVEQRYQREIQELQEEFERELLLTDEQTISAILAAVSSRMFESPDRNGVSNKRGQLYRLTYHRLVGTVGTLVQTVDYVGNDNIRAGKGRTIPAGMGVTNVAFTNRAAYWLSLNGDTPFDQAMADLGYDETSRASLRQDRRFWAAVPVYRGNLESFCGVVFCDSNDSDFLPESESSLRVRYLMFSAIILAKYESNAYEWTID